MKHTRKWAYIGHEAKRLADLGLTGYAIAKELGVNQSSITRWVKSGKMTLQRRKAVAAKPETVFAMEETPQSAHEWAKNIRANYPLDATDEKLVAIGEVALQKALDTDEKDFRVRIVAMGRFQAIVKQLALVARQSAKSEPITQRKTFEAAKRPMTDPRAALMAAIAK